MRSKPVEASLVGIVSVNVPAVTVCEPNVWTDTANSVTLVDLLLIISKASNAPLDVSAAHDRDALGVQNAVVPVAAGAVALVIKAPFAV